MVLCLIAPCNVCALPIIVLAALAQHLVCTYHEHEVAMKPSQLSELQESEVPSASAVGSSAMHLLSPDGMHAC